ncbi:hypothetical protein ASF71_01110 [Deinococcus sp. Leaf326]|nr:hypothetical protein ASF71_01110 [Deinococcus sp. Leaf326]
MQGSIRVTSDLLEAGAVAGAITGVSGKMNVLDGVADVDDVVLARALPPSDETLVAFALRGAAFRRKARPRAIRRFFTPLA